LRQSQIYTHYRGGPKGQVLALLHLKPRLRKAKSRDALAEAERGATLRGELILSPNDVRRYEGASLKLDDNRNVFVLKESQTGANEVFYDIEKSIVMDKDEFESAIESGVFPGYSIRIVNGQKVPNSKSDANTENDLS